MDDIEEIKNKYVNNSLYTLYQLIYGDDEYNIYAQDTTGNITDVYIEVSNPSLKDKLNLCIKQLNANPSINCTTTFVDGTKLKNIIVIKYAPTFIDGRNKIFDTIIEDGRDGTFEDDYTGGKKKYRIMKKNKTARKNKINETKKSGYRNKNKTRIANQPRAKQLFERFQRQSTLVFFEILLMIKLFHWRTHSYATHKATDELYSSFNEHMDKFIEVLLGKSGSRIHLMNQTNIKLEDMESQDRLKQKIDSFKSYLVGLDNNPTIKLMSNTDLLNIRDEMLADMNKFLYLLTFK